MDLSSAIIAETPFSKLLHHSSHHLSIVALSSTPSTSTAVRSPPRPSTLRSLARRSRRTRRKSHPDPDDPFFGDGDGDDGPFGGGGSGGGGSGRSNWGGEGDYEEEEARDPALFGFLYEVVLWIAVSNCTHFAFKKVGRWLAAERGRMLGEMC